MDSPAAGERRRGGGRRAEGDHRGSALRPGHRGALDRWLRGAEAARRHVLARRSRAGELGSKGPDPGVRPHVCDHQAGGDADGQCPRPAGEQSSNDESPLDPARHLRQHQRARWRRQPHAVAVHPAGEFLPAEQISPRREEDPRREIQAHRALGADPFACPDARDPAGRPVPGEGRDVRADQPAGELAELARDLPRADEARLHRHLGALHDADRGARGRRAAGGLVHGARGTGLLARLVRGDPRPPEARRPARGMLARHEDHQRAPPSGSGSPRISGRRTKKRSTRCSSPPA